MSYKKIFAAAAAAMLLCSCQKPDKSGSVIAEQQGNTLGNTIPTGEDYLTSYAKIDKLSMPEDITYLSKITAVDDGYLCLTSNDYPEIRILHFNEDFSDFTGTILVQPAPYDGYYYANSLVCFGEEQHYGLVVMENHSNMEPYTPDMGISPENYDWDTYYSGHESDYYLCTYAKDGTLADKIKIEGLEEYKDYMGYDVFYDFISDGENSYLSLDNGALLSIGKDGSLTEIIESGDEQSEIRRYFLRDRDGKAICFSRSEYYVEGASSSTLSEFDTKTGAIGEPFYTLDSQSVISASIFSGGWGDYRMFVCETDYSERTTSENLYGIRDDGTKEVVIDWTASDLEPTAVTPLADGTFIGNYMGSFYRITRKKASEVKNAQIITVGVFDSDYPIRDFIMDFNRSHDDYRLETVVYCNSDGTYYGDPEGSNDALENLKTGLISNNAPDILILDEMDAFHGIVLQLGARGAFCDLYEFMENDTEFNRTTLLPNVLQAMEHPNGKMYSLPSGFSVQTIAVKGKFNVKQNWTMDDMIQLYDNSDEIMYYWTTKQDTLEMMLMGADFTDEMNGTCSFDSPEFIRMLEFCNRYPTESNKPQKNYDDPAAMQQFSQWYTNKFNRFKNDQDYLYFTALSAFSTNSSMASGWAYTKAALGGGDVTLVGYPSDNGQGGKITANGEIAVLSNCSDKAAAWEVLKYYISNYSTNSGYSIFNENFEKQLDNEMYIWEFGEPSDAEYYDDDDRVYPLTQQERDRLEQYIRSCNTYMILDNTVKGIVYQEADKYFKGESTAAETAKMIQNSAALYLSEQYS